jgi:hypothetical protein
MADNPRKKAVSKPREQDQLPLAEALALRIEQTGDVQRAVLQIEDAMKRGELRSTRWGLATGKLETVLLPPSFWKAHLVHHEPTASGTPDAKVYLRSKGERPWSFWALNQHDLVGGRFYVSRSDFAKLWPAAEKLELLQVVKRIEEETDQRRKPGPKTTKRWKLHAAHEIWRVVIAEGREPNAPEIAEAVQKKTGYLPDDAHIRRLIRDLLE